MASPEDVALDPKAYRCESCSVKAAFDGLDVDGHRAWRVFQRVYSRFTVETRSTGTVLDRLTADMDPMDFDDLMQRLAMLYHVLYPPVRGRHGA